MDGFDPKSDFRFVIGEKPDVVILIFFGKIGTREIPVLQELDEQMSKKTQPIVLVNFHDVTCFQVGAHQWFAGFQRLLRDREKTLGICGLRPEIKSSLLMAGIVRQAEIYNNVPIAWKEIARKLKIQKPA